MEAFHPTAQNLKIHMGLFAIVFLLVCLLADEETGIWSFKNKRKTYLILKKLVIK